jgi:hypothetical protein
MLGGVLELPDVTQHDDDSMAARLAQATLRWPTNRWTRIGLILWGGLIALGWLGYWPLLQGVPGVYGLAWVYRWWLIVAVVAILGGLLVLPVVGMAFCLLLLLSLKSGWRRYTRQGARKLLLLLLIEAMAIMALLPSFLRQFETHDEITIAPWHTTYRAVYVAPLDDNYGDMMLLQCRWPGLCRQVYRAGTDVLSAEAATLDFNAATNEVGLYLEGRWVYVRSPGQPPCTEQLRSADEYGRCPFGE